MLRFRCAALLGAGFVLFAFAISAQPRSPGDDSTPNLLVGEGEQEDDPFSNEEGSPPDTASPLQLQFA